MCDVSDDKVEVKKDADRPESDDGYTEHTLYKDGVLTIGCVGKA